MKAHRMPSLAKSVYAQSGAVAYRPFLLAWSGGSWLRAVLIFFLVRVVFRLVADRRVGGVAWLIATYTLIRFFMGGDAFDFYQGLTLVGISMVSIVGAQVLDEVERRIHAPKHVLDRKVEVGQ